jgi:large subunit ribosomal protein L25
MKTITIRAEARTPGIDTSALRKAGKVPCVIYGGDENRHFSADVTAFKDLLYVSGLRRAEIELGGKTFAALVKEPQFHPVNDTLLHVDFLELNEGKPVRAEIPVRTTGRAKGELSGGKVYVNTPRLKVKAMPTDLTEYIEVDITELDLNDSVRISDLVERHPSLVFHHPDTVSVVSVETSRAARAAAAEEAAAAAKAAAAAIEQPVAEGEKKPEEATPAGEETEAKKEE